MSNTPGVSPGTPRIGWRQSFKTRKAARQEEKIISQQNASASKEIKGTSHVSQGKIKRKAVKATVADFFKGNIDSGAIKKRYLRYYQEYQAKYEMKANHGAYPANQAIETSRDIFKENQSVKETSQQVHALNWGAQALGELNKLKESVTAEGNEIKGKEEELYRGVKALEEQYADVYEQMNTVRSERADNRKKRCECAVSFQLLDGDKEDPDTIKCGQGQKTVMWEGTLGKKYQAVKDADRRLNEKREALSVAYRTSNADIDKAEAAYSKALAQRDEAQMTFKSYREGQFLKAGQFLKDANVQLKEKREALSAAYRTPNADIAEAETAYKEALSKRDKAQAVFGSMESYRDGQFEAKIDEYMDLIRKYGKAETQVWSAKKEFQAAERRPEDYPTEARWNFLSGLQDKFEAAKKMLADSRSEAETKTILGVMQQMIEHARAMRKEMIPEGCNGFEGKLTTSAKVLQAELNKICAEMECCIQNVKACGTEVLKEHEPQYPGLQGTLGKMQKLQSEMREAYQKREECPIEKKRELTNVYMDIYGEFTKALCSLKTAKKNAVRLERAKRSLQHIGFFQSSINWICRRDHANSYGRYHEGLGGIIL